MSHTFARRAAALALFFVVLGTNVPRSAVHAADPPEPFAVRPTAAEILARVTAGDALLDSYSVPVHVDVHLRKLISLHFGLNGMQYYKRPDHIALELRSMPAAYGRLFGEIGTPLTWNAAYDMRLLDQTAGDGHTTYHMEGVPRHPVDIVRVLLDIDTDATVPVRGQWFCKDGTAIAMTIDEQPTGPYQLPKHAEADLSASGFRIHAVLDYGVYAYNVAVADSVFAAE